MKTAMIAFISLFLFSSFATAGSCWPQWIKHKNCYGQIMLMNNKIFEVNGRDVYRTANWKRGDEVMLCYGFMINKTREDIEVLARQVYPMKRCSF